MHDPLASARRKVARAREHSAAFDAAEASFFDARLHALVVEPNPKQPAHEVYKLRFTQDLPDSFATLTSDAIHNLRDALDNAAYGLAVVSGQTNPRNTAFPFAG